MVAIASLLFAMKTRKLLLSLAFVAALLSTTAHSQSRVQKRSYFFKQADKQIEYRLFVPKNYREGTKSPLLVLLHGLGSNPSQVIRYDGIREEADRRGYIVVAPFGYNSRGWYGSLGKGKPQKALGGSEDDPENLGELSEKDVMNVLDIVRQEFDIDQDRIFLMGHSMGGGGTIHLGSTYPEVWAGLAALSPALFGGTARLEKMKHLPTIVVTGDKDRLVAVENVRRWVKEMDNLGMDHRYKEIAGGDHVFSITRNPKMIADVFEFFADKRRTPPSKR